jgi:nucleoside-diphosphate-sugar epimerase
VTAGPDLGLSSAVLDRIRPDITGIIHAAANTSFSADLDAARAVNVEGTRHVLEFAATCPRLDRMCVLSTTYVAGRRTGRILESELEHSAGFVNAYEQSKYEAERLVRRWMDRLPLSVIRLSTIVGGEPRIGEANGSPARLRAVHHAIRLMYRSLAPMVPGRPGNPVELLPARDAVSAASWLCTRGFAAGETAHVCGAADTMTLAEFIDHTMEAFRRFRPSWRKRAIEPPAIVDLETFELFRRSVDEVGDAVMREATAVIGSFAPQLAYPKAFDTTMCDRALAGSGIVRSSLREAYLETVRSLVEAK